MATGDIATVFIDAVRSQVEAASTSAALSDWHVWCQQQRFGPTELDQIPPNRVYGVTANVEMGSFRLSCFWDGLEQSVTFRDEATDQKICEIQSSKFYSAGHFHAQIRAKVAAAFEEAVAYLQQG